MIVYAVIVHLANVTTWKTAMLFTAFYSLTFLVGAFPAAGLRQAQDAGGAGAKSLRRLLFLG